MKTFLRTAVELFQDHFFIRVILLASGFLAGVLAGSTPYIGIKLLAAYLFHTRPLPRMDLSLEIFVPFTWAVVFVFLGVAAIILFAPLRVGVWHWAVVIGAPLAISLGALFADPRMSLAAQALGSVCWLISVGMVGTGVWLIRSFRENDLGAERESIRITNGMRRFRREGWGIWDERQEGSGDE